MRDETVPRPAATEVPQRSVCTGPIEYQLLGEDSPRYICCATGSESSRQEACALRGSDANNRALKSALRAMALTEHAVVREKMIRTSNASSADLVALVAGVHADLAALSREPSSYAEGSPPPASPGRCSQRILRWLSLTFLGSACLLLAIRAFL